MMKWVKWGMKDSYSSVRRRPRSTPEQRVQWVRRYKRSGWSQREFAERHGLGIATLRKWISQEGNQILSGGNGKTVWRELKLDGLPGPGRWAAEVVRPDGYVVRLAHDTPACLLEELLRAGPC
jgi:hypothetical protein